MTIFPPLFKTICLICAVFLSGCVSPEVPPTETRMATSFVQAYYPIEKITAQVRDQWNILLWSQAGDPLPTQKAQALNLLHQDVCEEYTYSVPSDDNIFTIAQDFTAVSVSCDRDFDEGHPAGSDLGDVIAFYSVSCYPFIRSGQKDTYDWTTQKEDFSDWFLSRKDPRWSPVYKKVSELSSDDLVLLGPSLRHSCLLAKLRLLKRPSGKGAFSFRIGLTDTQGKSYEANRISMDF